MCGRYAFFAAPHRLIDIFGAIRAINFPARYNAAPIQDMPILVKNHIGMARWGLLPPWADADDRGLCAKMINARSETVAEKPAFSAAWAKGRRCLIPANGFFEWQGAENERPDTKQPYYIHHKSEELVGFAGLWAKKDDLVTFTLLTKQADGAIADIHHRMPVILTPSQASSWFAADLAGAQKMIAAASGVDMAYRPVGRDVGKVANDHPDLLAEVAPAPRPVGLLL